MISNYFSESMLLSIIFAICIFVVGYIVSKYVRHITRKLLKEYDVTLSCFISRVVYVLSLMLTVVIALAELGVPISPITGMLTGVIFGVSLSLKSSYSILASGVMIAFSKPFDIGDNVDIGGSAGIVKSIGFLYTVLVCEDKSEIVISNSMVLAKIITKYK